MLEWYIFNTTGTDPPQDLCWPPATRGGGRPPWQWRLGTTAWGGVEKGAETRARKGVSCRIICSAEEGSISSMKPGDGVHQRELKKAYLPDDRIVTTFTLICKILSGVELNDS